MIHPFEGRNADEVWKELLAISEPLPREEMIKQIREENGKKKNTVDDKD
ncbi:hypothetical protein [Adhaeribacter arboris]|nr:hypothetical protein [Adhaeribacter arboris]